MVIDFPNQNIRLVLTIPTNHVTDDKLPFTVFSLFMPGDRVAKRLLSQGTDL